MYCEGGSSENQFQSPASVCVRDTQGQREPLTQRHAGLGGKERMGDSLLPSLPRKPKPDVGKHPAGSRPTGRQTGLAKRPAASQKFLGPLGVAPPQLAPLQTGRPRQQVLPCPFTQ